LSTADNKNDFIISCGIYRTSRKIMDGKIYIPQNINDH
jgi:2-methylaconitate cis-trans-isomerase PrpF